MISLNQISITAGTFRLSDISLSVPTGQYGVLMGKTGCGKTTILESILGLRQVTLGQIELEGRIVTGLDPAVRGIGYVPQDGALFRKMTVREHLGFALMIRGVSKRPIEQRISELAEMLSISHLLDRRPKGLSGGERQRVALGRALSFRPRVLCLDEPLSALDRETRVQMCNLLSEVKQKTGVTTLHVTHSIDEAERLADCLFQMKDSQISMSTD